MPRKITGPEPNPPAKRGRGRPSGTTYTEQQRRRSQQKRERIANGKTIQDDESLTLAQFCRRLGINRQTVYRRHDHEGLPLAKVGGRVVISGRAYNEWIYRKSVGAGPTNGTNPETSKAQPAPAEA